MVEIADRDDLSAGDADIAHSGGAIAGAIDNEAVTNDQVEMHEEPPWVATG